MSTRDPMAIGLIIAAIFVLGVITGIIDFIIMLITGWSWGWWMTAPAIMIVAFYAIFLKATS